ncbi:MAG: hypothetical protein ACRDTT_12095, partial [Pseudonocardiaceae bacterium]
VRRRGGPLAGRALGTVQRVRDGWIWTPTRLAYVGDGRPGSERDGERATPVPRVLLTGGQERTRTGALEALVAWLRDHEAPVLGYGPHRDVAEHRFAGR